MMRLALFVECQDSRRGQEKRRAAQGAVTGIGRESDGGHPDPLSPEAAAQFAPDAPGRTFHRPGDEVLAVGVSFRTSPPDLHSPSERHHHGLGVLALQPEQPLFYPLLHSRPFVN